MRAWPWWLAAAQSRRHPRGPGGAGFKAVRDRGVLKVGIKVDVPKFGFKDPNTGEISGMEIDLAHRMAKETLGDASKVGIRAGHSQDAWTAAR